jgi:hypothetical protein
MPIKKEEMEPISRRLSVSSTSSANGGSSDWDDSGMFGAVLALFSAFTDFPNSFTLFFWLSASIWLQLASCGAISHPTGPELPVTAHGVNRDSPPKCSAQ